MADYRELLRRAVDALPENTGSNRRAVYEKARSALVAQLRAIEPPLPAREITTHRLNLEDCIREVEHEATEKLLGRFKQVEMDDEEAAREAALSEDPSALAPEPDFPENAESAASLAEIEPEPDDLPDADETRSDVESAVEIEPVIEPEAEPEIIVAPEPKPEPEPEVEEEISSEAFIAPELPIDTASEMSAVEADEPEDKDTAIAPIVDVPEDDGRDETPIEADLDTPADAVETKEDDSPAPYAPGSIEDIIARAQLGESEPVDRSEPDAFDQSPAEGDAEPVPGAPEPASERKVLPFTSVPLRGPIEPTSSRNEHPHFITSANETSGGKAAPLVDLHGQPLSRGETGAPGQAMASVREVDVEPGIGAAPDLTDAQSSIDRAIEALDREARGDAEAESAATEADTGTDSETSSTPDASEGGKSGGFGALTVFLLIAVLLLGGGGAAGFWAWREGYINLDAVFAQTDGDSGIEVAEGDAEPVLDSEEPATTGAAGEAGNTTPDVPVVEETPAPDGAETTVPGTESATGDPTEPEAAFEDRLPSEAGERESTDDAPAGDAPQIAVADGPQSLLLEEQAAGATGAVPYSGSVEWSRGSDELGHPTIEASASIPARNLDVDILLRRNADTNLPASHLMEINFNVAESFVGGSIANLPGVLLKDEELVQGQPLTGASARIVGNSFLFALSSASDQDVANNVSLLDERAWLDLAMVYGTGRRAILTLEKGEDGEAIFDAVMAEWATLDAEAGDTPASEAPAADDAEGAEATEG